LLPGYTHIVPPTPAMTSHEEQLAQRTQETDEGDSRRGGRI